MASQNPVRITVLISGEGSSFFSFPARYLCSNFDQGRKIWRFYSNIGAGTNLQALINARDESLKQCSIVRVISSRKKAGGLNRAEQASIPTHHQLASTSSSSTFSYLVYKKAADLISKQ